MKVSIVGVGRVGSALGAVLVARQVANELVLVGRSLEKTVAEALDLSHAAALGRPTRVIAGDIAATTGSDVIVLSFGQPMVVYDRTESASENYAVLASLVPQLATASPSAVLIVATNPVDAMTTLAGRLSGFPPERVLGTGTLVDTMRLRAALSERLGIHPLDIRAYVLGEHGDSQFAAFSFASAGGGSLDLSPEDAQAIEASVRQIGYSIVKGKGHTCYGIALATAEIVEAILRDTRQVMPLSVLVDGFAGVNDVSLSLPVVIGQGGVRRRIKVQLSAAETSAFVHSADLVRKTVSSLHTPVVL